MKIRIQNNIVKIRLNNLEVEDFQQGQELLSKTSFPGNNLTFSLMTDQSNTADFVANTVNITVDDQEVSQWASTDEVTIAMEFDMPNDEKLSILVEKDMKV